MGPPGKRGRFRRIWRPLRLVVSFVLLGVAVWVVKGKSSELSGASVFLSQIRWQWLVMAVAAETCTYLALAHLQRTLLRAGGVRGGLGRNTAMALAGSAIQSALPVGAAFAGVYEFRQYQYMGADDILAGFVVLGSGTVAFFTLAGLAGVGLALAASTGSAFDLVGAIVGVLCIALLGLIAWARRATVYRWVTRMVTWAERLSHRPAGQWTGPFGSTIDRVRAVAPEAGDLARASAASALSWLSDCMCLACAFLAVSTAVPWQGLLLAYCGGQLAVNLPITPGGLGVVEGSLTVALVAFGPSQAATVAAVLLYRLVSFWLPLPVGGLAYLGLARRRHREIATAERRAQALGSEGRGPLVPIGEVATAEIPDVQRPTTSEPRVDRAPNEGLGTGGA